MTWPDLGGVNRADFIQQCRQEWALDRNGLSTSQLTLSVEACEDGRTTLEALDCDVVRALYAR